MSTSRRLPRLALATITAVLLSLGLTSATTTATAAAPQFSDVPPSHTFYEHITAMAEDGLVNGFADGTFRPSASLTRGQLAVVLFNAIGDDYTPPAQARFSDVPRTHSFYRHISYLSAEGAISGFSDGTFRPNAPVTRGQFSAIIVNLFDGPTDQPERRYFSDVPPSHTFYRHIGILHEYGFINGFADGTFRPNASLTRGQFSVVMANFFGLLR